MSVMTYHQSKLALGSDTTLVITSGEPQSIVDDIFAKLWLLIFRFESRFSRFLPTSELSVFNRNAGLKTPVSTEFLDLVVAAKRMAQKTGGLYNPFILPALQKAGYKKSFVKTYSEDPIDDYSERAIAPFEKLHIDQTNVTIPANTAIDFGGIGKGYLADKLSAIPELSATQGFWFSLGGDVIGQGFDEQGNPWRVSVQDSKKPSELLKMSFASDENLFAVATSGTITRHGRDGNTKWHHIINPLTRQPAVTDILLATVAAETAQEADVYASCAVILGSKLAPEFLKIHGVESYVFQTSSDRSNDSLVLQGKFIKHKEAVL